MPSSVTEASHSLLNIIDMVPTSKELLLPDNTLSWAMSGKPSSTYLSDYINGKDSMTAIGFYPKEQNYKTKVFIKNGLTAFLAVPIISAMIGSYIGYLSPVNILAILIALLSLMITRLCLISKELKKLIIPLDALKRLQISINYKLFQSKNIMKRMIPIIEATHAIEKAVKIQKNFQKAALIGTGIIIISLLNIITTLGLSIISDSYISFLPFINGNTPSILGFTSTSLIGLSIIWHLGYGVASCIRSISKNNTCSLIKKSLTDLAKARHEN